MLKLTPAESDLLRPWLISRMRTGGQTINDKALAEELDPDGSLGWYDGGSYKGLSHALFHIPTFEVEHGRPVGLVALVINETGSHSWVPATAQQLLFAAPGGARPQKRFWTLKLAAATLYWTEGHANRLTPDAQVDAI